MRIRSIKPEFWRSPDISSLTVEDRLLFIGLWSYVDDNGVGQDRVSVIAADLFADDLSRHPRDTLARVADGLQRLAEAGRITRYTVENREFLAVTNWERHQRIDRPNKPRYPLPTSDNAEVRETIATPSRVLREDSLTGTEEQRNRGTGEQNIYMSEASSDVPARKPNTYPDAFEEWWRAYPRHKNASKKKSLDAWRKALKVIDESRLLKLTRVYAANPGVEEVRLIPHPTTWLNEQRWESIDDADMQPPTQPRKKTGWDFGRYADDQPPIIDAEVYDMRGIAQ